MLSTVSSDKILEIVRDWNVLALRGPQEVLHDRIAVVTEADFDWSVKTMKVSILAGPLIRLVLLHQRKKFLGGPALALEVIIVRGRSTGVHLLGVRTCSI